MTNAIGIVTGKILVASDKQLYHAWQVLIDSGKLKDMQKAYRDVAADFIKRGKCRPKKSTLKIKALK